MGSLVPVISGASLSRSAERVVVSSQSVHIAWSDEQEAYRIPCAFCRRRDHRLASCQQRTLQGLVAAHGVSPCQLGRQRCETVGCRPVLTPVRYRWPLKVLEEHVEVGHASNHVRGPLCGGHLHLSSHEVRMELKGAELSQRPVPLGFACHRAAAEIPMRPNSANVNREPTLVSIDKPLLSPSPPSRSFRRRSDSRPPLS